jgi:hypothetical protein
VIKLYRHDEITEESHFSSINPNYQIIYTYTKQNFNKQLNYSFMEKV